MRKTFIAVAATLAVIFATMLAFDATGVMGVINPVTPYDADVNKDGHVNSTDMLNVAKNCRKPVVMPVAALRRRRWLGTGRSAVTTTTTIPMRIINTSDGSVVATLPIGEAQGTGSSCDGRYALINIPGIGGGGPTIGSIIRLVDGSTVVTEPAVMYPPSAIFTCPLKGWGARFDTGGPVADRAVVRGCDASSVGHLRLFDLTGGQLLHSSDTSAVSPGVRL